jgi:hypothetical protein
VAYKKISLSGKCRFPDDERERERGNGISRQKDIIKRIDIHNTYSTEYTNGISYTTYLYKNDPK